VLCTCVQNNRSACFTLQTQSLHFSMSKHMRGQKNWISRDGNSWKAWTNSSPTSFCSCNVDSSFLNTCWWYLAVSSRSCREKEKSAVTHHMNLGSIFSLTSCKTLWESIRIFFLAMVTNMALWSHTECKKMLSVKKVLFLPWVTETVLELLKDWMSAKFYWAQAICQALF
jgi:hypothetical protein